MILVTGGTGFIGNALASRLESIGQKFTLVSRRAGSGKRLICDLEKQALAPEQLAGFDAIIHLAGFPLFEQTWSEDVRHRIYDSRVASTRNLVSSLAKLPSAQRPKLWISASAIGYYGHRGDEVLTEESQPGAGFLASVCEDWERESQKVETLGIRSVQVRIGLVLGAGGGMLRSLLPIFRLGLGGKLGDGKQWMSWISIEDLVSAFVYILNHPSIRGPVNAVSPNPVRNEEFTRTLGRVLSRPAYFRVPEFALRLALEGWKGSGEVAAIALSSQCVRPEKLLASGFSFTYPHLEGALRHIVFTRPNRPS